MDMEAVRRRVNLLEKELMDIDKDIAAMLEDPANSLRRSLITSSLRGIPKPKRRYFKNAEEVMELKRGRERLYLEWVKAIEEYHSFKVIQ